MHVANPKLVSFPVGAGAVGVAPYVQALREMLDGGAALRPYAAGQKPEQIGLGGQTVLPEDLGLVVSTSGTTGKPKQVLLSRENLRASAAATNAFLGRLPVPAQAGGTAALSPPARWALCLPAQHVAGTQVLVRSIVQGTEPLICALPDLPAHAALLRGRWYCSLVPAQVVTALHSPELLHVLRCFAAILVGGGPIAAGTAAAAKAAGLRLVRTYGASETAGGCVYDGQPLPGVRVHFRPMPEHEQNPSRGGSLPQSGRIGLSGPMVASGYLGQSSFSEGIFWSDDFGFLRDGRLEVLGRVDDAINSGGYKVSAAVVSEALTALGCQEFQVLALPHEKWGECVAVALTRRGSPKAYTLGSLRAELSELLPAFARPQALLYLEDLPLRGLGKPDLAALVAHSDWVRGR